MPRKNKKKRRKRATNSEAAMLSDLSRATLINSRNFVRQRMWTDVVVAENGPLVGAPSENPTASYVWSTSTSAIVVGAQNGGVGSYYHTVRVNANANAHIQAGATYNADGSVNTWNASNVSGYVAYSTTFDSMRCVGMVARFEPVTRADTVEGAGIVGNHAPLSDLASFTPSDFMALPNAHIYGMEDGVFARMAWAPETGDVADLPHEQLYYYALPTASVDSDASCVFFHLSCADAQSIRVTVSAVWEGITDGNGAPYIVDKTRRWPMQGDRVQEFFLMDQAKWGGLNSQRRVMWKDDGGIGQLVSNAVGAARDIGGIFGKGRSMGQRARSGLNLLNRIPHLVSQIGGLFSTDERALRLLLVAEPAEVQALRALLIRYFDEQGLPLTASVLPAFHRAATAYRHKRRDHSAKDVLTLVEAQMRAEDAIEDYVRA